MTTLRTATTLGLLVVALLAAAAVLARTDDATDPMGVRASTATTATTTRATGGTAPAPTAPREPATGLDPGLVVAFERARTAAADAGHTLVVNSGFRTAARQQELLDEEVAERGSVEEAMRWVFPPERSMHVQGLAIDVGDGPAADWLAANGAAYGICHTLAWEWWHFEWRARWEAAGACPAEAQDPAEAPGV